MNVIERDSYAGWVLQCLGVWNDGDYLDKMEKDFGVELNPSGEETIEDIRIELEMNSDRPRLGDVFARHIFDIVIEKAVNELGANESNFEYSVNGYYDTYLMYKSNVVSTWDDIVKIYNKKSKRRTINE